MMDDSHMINSWYILVKIIYHVSPGIRCSESTKHRMYLLVFHFSWTIIDI